MSSSDAKTVQEELLTCYETIQSGRQWPLLIRLFFDELIGNGGEEDAYAFLTHLGSRLAESLPLGEQETLADLEQAMNRHWASMSWGKVKLTVVNDAIEVCHLGCPMPAAEQHKNAMVAILIGVYGHWLDTQSGESLNLQPTSTDDRRRLFFSYGG